MLPNPADRPKLSVVLLVAVMLVALTMRSPIIAVAPAIGDVRADLHISAATAGLLTTIPVLCFGLGTPLVLAVVRRGGLDNAVLVGLAGTLAGVLLRSLDGLATALIGTLIIGLSVTIGNVVVPVIIGRDFAGRTSIMTAVYSSSLNVGSMLATTISAPLAGWVGWRPALASWGLLALLAAAVWRRAVPGARAIRPATSTSAESAVTPRPDQSRSQPRDDRPRPASRPLWRRRLVVGMTLVLGCQAFSYYGVSAWLPSLLADDLRLSPTAAGASSSIFQVVAVVGAFAIPAMIARRLAARFIFLVVCAAWIALPLGLAFAPALWPLWCAFGGLAQGGGFTVIFSVIVERAADERDSRQISAAVQGVGYCLGATGPFVIGFVHSTAGGWRFPMIVIAAAIIVMAVAGSIAIGARPQPSR